MYEKIKIDDVKINNIQIIIDEDNMCIVCLDEIGCKKLCLKCKYKYCSKCAVKLNNKCCVCYRNTNNNSYFAYSELEINLVDPPFYTTIISLLCSIVIYCLSIITAIIIMVYSTKILSNLIIFILNKFFYYLMK